MIVIWEGKFSDLIRKTHFDTLLKEKSGEDTILRICVSKDKLQNFTDITMYMKKIDIFNNVFYDRTYLDIDDVIKNLLYFLAMRQITLPSLDKKEK